MKHSYFLLTILIFGLVVHSCELRTSNVSSAEKIKQDSIFRVDSIKSVFSNKIKESNRKEVYKIKRGVKMILADNQDTYILKGELPIIDCYVEIYSSDEQTGEVVIIYWNKELNSVMEFIVTQTVNNVTDLGYETTYV
jgi:hypothetical protein